MPTFDLCALLGLFEPLFSIIEQLLGWFGLEIDIMDLFGCDD